MVALFGAVTAIVGVLLIRHPIGGVTAIALLIGLWLIVIGVIRFATAFDESERRGWYVFAGALELIAGVVIVANPDLGFATLAVLVGGGCIVNASGWESSARPCGQQDDKHLVWLISPLSSSPAAASQRAQGDFCPRVKAEAPSVRLPEIRSVARYVSRYHARIVERVPLAA